MAARPSFTVKGIPELERKLKELPPKVRESAKAVLEEASEAVKDDAQRSVPVDSGFLRDHIIAEVEDDGSAAIVGIIDDEAYYGQFVEHGTSSIPEQPFLMPAAERERKRLPKRFKSHGIKGII